MTVAVRPPAETDLSLASARVSVPGKLILIGEHAAVHGRLAVVAAVGLRLRAHLRHGSGHAGVAVHVPALDALRGGARWGWEEIIETTRSVRKAWHRYDADPGPATFAALRHQDAGGLAKLALGEAVLALEAADLVHLEQLPSLSLSVESELPVGAGFGSSAAASLAIVTATVATLCGDVRWELVNAATLEVERRQHGSPSGVDAATVFHGGVLTARRDLDGGVTSEPLPAVAERLSGLRVYDTGPRGESTGEVVAAVRALGDRDSARFERQLDRMGELAGRLSAALVDADAKTDALLAPIREYHRCLVAFGVVPERVCQLIDRIEAAGGAAKISGAGSLSGPGAGSLLVVHPQPERIAEWPFLADLIAYPVRIGVEGVRVESIS